MSVHFHCHLEPGWLHGWWRVEQRSLLVSECALGHSGAAGRIVLH